MRKDSSISDQVGGAARADARWAVLSEVLASQEGYTEYLRALADQPWSAPKDADRAQARSVLNLARAAKARLDYGYRRTCMLRTEEQIATMGGKVIPIFRGMGILQDQGPRGEALMWPDEAIAAADGELGERFRPQRFRNYPKRFDLSDPEQRALYAEATAGVSERIAALSPAADWVLRHRYGLGGAAQPPEGPVGTVSELRRWCEDLGSEIAEVCFQIDRSIRRIAAERKRAERERAEADAALEAALAVEAATPPAAAPTPPAEAQVPPRMPAELVITPEEALRLPISEIGDRMRRQDEWRSANGMAPVGGASAKAVQQ